MKASSKQTKVSTIEIPSEISGLVHRYHDRLLADNSLSDLDVILLSLYLIDLRNKKAGAQYDDCKDFFVLLGRREVNYKANIYLGKKGRLIEEKDSILNLTVDGLKRIRKLLGQLEKTPVYVIKSGQNFTAIQLLEKFLLEEIVSEDILLCDPYVSHSTLYPFSILKSKLKSLKILTSNIYDNDKFDEYSSKMEKETGISVEVKVSQKIHDRYLISGERCWSFGSSIKDLGNKDTTIKEISEVTTSMKDIFLERWNEH